MSGPGNQLSIESMHSLIILCSIGKLFLSQLPVTTSQCPRLIVELSRRCNHRFLDLDMLYHSSAYVVLEKII